MPYCFALRAFYSTHAKTNAKSHADLVTGTPSKLIRFILFFGLSQPAAVDRQSQVLFSLLFTAAENQAILDRKSG